MYRTGTALALAVALTAPALPAQSRSAQLVTTARAHLAASRLDSADAALHLALASAAYAMDSAHVLIWRGILEHLRGSDSLARLAFRGAISLRSGATVRGLELVSPALAELFEAEVRAASVYPLSALDATPSRRSGPTVEYPPELRRRRVAGRATLRFVLDTSGNVEERSVEVLESPDSALVAPLKRMIVATTFTPGRVKGRAVRSLAAMSLNVTPPAPPSAAQLVGAARKQLAARRSDSALALLAEALDTATHPSEAERTYALLVQGLAWRAAGRDSLSARSIDAGLAGYRDLTERGVDLAPVLRRLADSLRVSRRPPPVPARPASSLASPAALDSVDEQPALVSHPPIRYAPEMQALRVGGTVVVEATLDTTGRVLPATVRIVQSPNPVFDTEARRVVAASVYRPARRAGRAVRTGIRQPITFAPY